jgi:parallel beta-helix repeat protein
LGGVELIISDNNTITDNTISSNNFSGIEFYGSNNNIIGNNISSNHKEGIYLSGYNNFIIGNKILNNQDDGIYLKWPSSSNIIKDNNVSLNHNEGINLSNTNITSIMNNSINGNLDGIVIDDSYNNKITNNTISDNKFSGLIITSLSSYNMITGNTISNNRWFSLLFGEECNYNTIFHNNFIKNNWNVFDDNNNTWDDGSYGNFWDDYKLKYPLARKIWRKGIWDTPYEIPGGNNTDRYPLINQWPNSRTRTIPRTQTTFNSLFHWLFERFPLLERLLVLIKMI